MSRLYLGCGPGYPHQQHKDIMGDWQNWIFIDKYVDRDKIPLEVDFRDWNAETLYEFSDGTVDEIYASHLLEHIPHTRVKEVLGNWYRKIKKGGKITLNVPDLQWVCLQLLKYEKGESLKGYYHQFEGEHGLLSIFYGSESHEGEYHKSGFIRKYLENILLDIGFIDVRVIKIFDAHDMGVLIATAKK